MGGSIFKIISVNISKSNIIFFFNVYKKCNVKPLRPCSYFVCYGSYSGNIPQTDVFLFVHVLNKQDLKGQMLISDH